jgi:hypothetical protein
MSTQQFVDALRPEGVWMMVLGSGRARAVTHYGIARQDVERALQVMRRIMTV